MMAECATTVAFRVCRSMPNDSSAGAFCGHRRSTGWFRLRRPSLATCWKVLIGVTRSTPGGRLRQGSNPDSEGGHKAVWMCCSPGHGRNAGRQRSPEGRARCRACGASCRRSQGLEHRCPDRPLKLQMGKLHIEKLRRELYGQRSERTARLLDRPDGARTRGARGKRLPACSRIAAKIGPAMPDLRSVAPADRDHRRRAQGGNGGGGRFDRGQSAQPQEAVKEVIPCAT